MRSVRNGGRLNTWTDNTNRELGYAILPTSLSLYIYIYICPFSINLFHLYLYELLISSLFISHSLIIPLVSFWLLMFWFPSLNYYNSYHCSFSYLSLSIFLFLSFFSLSPFSFSNNAHHSTPPFTQIIIANFLHRPPSMHMRRRLWINLVLLFSGAWAGGTARPSVA